MSWLKIFFKKELQKYLDYSTRKNKSSIFPI